MYKISYEKCVCFVFLVILAVLSCTGFRIDNLAMTDVSKRNFHSSPTIDRIFHVPHRIRHQRLLRTRHHVKPHVEALIFPPTTQPSEHLAQVPSTDLQNTLHPTKSIISRPQRSSEHKRHHRQESKWLPHQEDDISLRAYKAEIVLLAQAVGCDSFCQCVFKVNTTYKNTKQFLVVDRIMLKVNCQAEEKPHNRRNLVKNKILLRKKYVLFLNASSSSNFWSVGAPKLVKPNKEFKTEKIIKHACRPKLVPTTPKVVELKDISRRQNEKRKLLCRVKGFPVPKIQWRRKGEVLRQNQHMRIQYRRKQSRLTIKKMDADHIGEYECVAESVDGRKASKAITVTNPSQTFSESFSSGKECKGPMKTNFCYNGGTCHKEVTMEEYYCICPPGYSGQKCDVKEPSLSRLLTMAFMSDPYEGNTRKIRAILVN